MRSPALATRAVRVAMVVLASLAPAVASAQPARARWPVPDGAEIVRLLGPHAAAAFTVPGAPARAIHARVVLPPGTRAGDLGLPEIVPGLARLSASPAGIVAFADAHPDLRLEVTPPLHALLDTASGFVTANQAIAEGLDGSGVVVGVADTGLDVTHPDFLDAQGHTRVAWLLDLSAAPRGVHPDLEQLYGVPADPASSGGGAVVAGAVWSADDIDGAIASGETSTLPQDEVGHGTLVTACAAANGLSGTSSFRGVAPGATLVVARITGSHTESIDTDDVLRAVAFLFDRGAALGKPVVVNLSLGTDFGPHDGTMAWEQALASYVGPSHPGRALVAAAGNSGSIVPGDGPLAHQSVFVSHGTTMRVPMPARAATSGGVQVWVAMHAGSSLRVGLDGPDGTWIAPVGAGLSGGHASAGYSAAVYNGAQLGSLVPSGSQGAIVVWQGMWPAGTYAVTLSGSGTADLYVDATGDALSTGGLPFGFADGVREGTINLPATHPGIIGVGCTINKKGWRGVDGAFVRLSVPLLDAAGGTPDETGAARDALDGEPCWFSSAGPTLTGVAKPEILAPGAAIVGAMSQQAVPPAAGSIFSDATCPSGTECQVIDDLHGVAAGTSFSSPLVAGAVAVLLQRDPTLTQDAIVAALQGGAHRLRGPSAFADQAGPGELDVIGAVAAADRIRDPSLAVPLRSASWLAPSADEFLADGSTPFQAVLQLRAAPAASGPRPADGFEAGRLAAYARVDGRPYAGAATLARRGPGVWLATVHLPAGLGGLTLTFGATFDGQPVVDEKTVPIATDVWSAVYPTRVRGGCSSVPRAPGPGGLPLVAIVALAWRRRRGPADVERLRARAGS